MSFRPRLAAAVAAATLFTPAVAAAQTPGPEHTVSVIGRGQVELRPDRGSFTVAVVREARSANDARNRANAKVAAIVGGLRGLGIARNQLTTNGVSIARRKRRTRKDEPVRVSFRADISLRVAVEGLALLGRAIDAASRRGATAVFGPQLSFSPELRETGSLRSEAAALDDARTRAEAAAAAEGQQIVGVQSIDLDPGQNGFSAFALETSAAGSADSRARSPTKIFSARRKVTSVVRVTYIIEPAA